MKAAPSSLWKTCCGSNPLAANNLYWYHLDKLCYSEDAVAPKLAVFAKVN
jgi:hypothetical protein